MHAHTQWWFCLIHQAVEAEALDAPDSSSNSETSCPNASRLGPYESEGHAQGVLERMHARTTQADNQDD